MEMPCRTCPVHQTYAHLFDIHILGEDCPEGCEEYKRWKAEREEEHGLDDSADNREKPRG